MNFFPKLLAPPRVRFFLKQKLLGTAARFYGLQIFRSLQSGRKNNLCANFTGRRGRRPLPRYGILPEITA